MSTAPTQKEQHRMFLFQKHDINEIGIIDTTDATNEAREKAIDNAKHKAEDYADLLDVDLGAVLVVTEVSAPSGVTPILARDGGMAAGSPATQIDLGVQEVSVTVEVRWALSN